MPRVPVNGDAPDNESHRVHRTTEDGERRTTVTPPLSTGQSAWSGSAKVRR